MPYTLSPQQAAVENWIINDDGSLELVARAGCGKTFTLIHVAVRTIIARGLGQVAIMAYNRSIADELKVKLTELGIDWKQAEANTVHAFGLRAWKKVAPKIADRNYKPNTNKVRDIINAQCEVPDEKTVWTECAAAIARLVTHAKQRAVGHLCAIDDQSVWYDILSHFSIEEDITENYTEAEVVAAAIKVYRISLDLCREDIDFDDMILAPLYFKCRFWQLDWILIDESQDTNPARRALALAMLKPRTGRVIFVGDDRQAIYGFTGADADSMDQLRHALKAKTLPLNVTYRCPKAVVALAQTMVPDFTAHESAPEGKLSTIQYDVLDQQNLSYEDAILCRNTAPLVTTAYTLLGKGIACKVAGKDIGAGLIKLARKWKVTGLNALEGKLKDYVARETAKLMSKDKQGAIQNLEDQVDCLFVLINRCKSLNRHNVADLIREIESLFGDEKEMATKRVLTLMTAHRSKGLEWKRVFILGRAKFMPSSYAKKDWEKQQEANIEYVAVTRAKEELIDVVMPAKQK
jgi:superfamily I DNA/RNA helicase